MIGGGGSDVSSGAGGGGGSSVTTAVTSGVGVSAGISAAGSSVVSWARAVSIKRATGSARLKTIEKTVKPVMRVVNKRLRLVVIPCLRNAAYSAGINPV
ncbi:MAG: hypothetical protein DWB42_00775 [Chloroflexi bacterium]|nr:hypothetical protein [Chloroflexota bacterium]MDL1882039.1 hypothetical protein [Anaerolineae bacterium CFX8]